MVPLSAMMRSVFYVHNVIPGPQLFQDDMDFVVALYLALLILILNVLVVALLLVATNQLIKVVKIPNRFLGVCILILSFVGVYSLRNALTDCIIATGLPDGVLNVVTGAGSVTGEALALSMDVDVLVFTGSGGVGRRLVDFIGWQDVPSKLTGQEVHAHNRLLSSVMMTPDQRREMAQAMCTQLSGATGPVNLILPLQGGNEWDRPGGPLHDADGLAAFIDEIRAHCPDNVTLIELDAHINDTAFSDRVLAEFDRWVAAGIVIP